MPALVIERSLPSVVAVISLFLESQQVGSSRFEGEVPKEIMDAYKEVVGDGLAKVSVSADMSIKDYGTGASAMCSITLTCGQDEKTLERALELAGSLARSYAQENRQRAENELQEIIRQRGFAPR